MYRRISSIEFYITVEPVVHFEAIGLWVIYPVCYEMNPTNNPCKMGHLRSYSARAIENFEKFILRLYLVWFDKCYDLYIIRVHWICISSCRGSEISCVSQDPFSMLLLRAFSAELARDQTQSSLWASLSKIFLSTVPRFRSSLTHGLSCYETGL